MNTLMELDSTCWLSCYRWQNTNLLGWFFFHISALLQSAVCSRQQSWHIHLSPGRLAHTPQRKTSHSVSLSSWISGSVMWCVLKHQILFPVQKHKAHFRGFLLILFHYTGKLSLRLHTEKHLLYLYNSCYMILWYYSTISWMCWPWDCFVTCCFQGQEWSLKQFQINQL